MTSDAQLRIPFNNHFAALPSQLYSETQPTQVRKPSLIKLNSALALELGLDADALNTQQGAELFAGNVLPTEAKPLAMAYAGHQFGNWVPKLGDGRAVLLGDLLDINGQYREIQLKGAGVTPYSRNGDGRAWLGPILREYIVSEAMHALGVPTTRALAAVLTGEPVYREAAYPGAIITRVAKSHIRVGTFQYFIARGDLDAIESLINHLITHCYPELADEQNSALALFNAVINGQANLVAHWQSLGFIHGVMNTDNMAISGETIDYGPCAFLDSYDPKKVFSSIDQMGRYAYANQPAAAHWNLSNFAQALLPFINEDKDAALEQAQAALDQFPDQYHTAYNKQMLAKLGIEHQREGDIELLGELLDIMLDSESDFTLTFSYLTNLLKGKTDTVLDTEAHFKPATALQPWVDKWQIRLNAETRKQSDQYIMMRQHNPQLIPRNHRIEECIQAALQNDYKPFNELVEALQMPYLPKQVFGDLAAAPGTNETITQTFCGT